MSMAIDTRTLDFVALGILTTVVIFFVYLVIYIHDIPYEKAKERGHPHRDAIHVAGWVSLFLLHVLWPFLWIWAFLYKPGEGWGIETVEVKDSTKHKEEIAELKGRLEKLEKMIEPSKDEEKEEVK